MTWQPELDELRQRERMARELGGPDKVKRQHDAGNDHGPPLPLAHVSTS